MSCEDVAKWIWKKTTIKNFFILVFLVLVSFLMLNLWTMINHLDTSYMYTHSLDSNSTDTLEITQKWAIRGQMGDILSGHFSALAFLAVAFSILLQNEANKQIREDIKKQEERFNIDNMNNRLKSHYHILDDKLKNVEVAYENLRISLMTNDPIHIEWVDKAVQNEYIEVLNFIYDDIDTIKLHYPLAYTDFMKELTLKLRSNSIVRQMSQNKSLNKPCKAFSLL